MAIVFFDIDRTLIDTNSALDIVKYYLKKRLFGPRQVLWSVVYHVLYRLDLANPQQMMLKGLTPFVGRVRAEVQFELRQVFEQALIKRLYQNALDTIAWHQNHGDTVILLSSTLWDVAGLIAEYCGLDYIATMVELENDRYTHKLVQPVPFGTGKLILAHQYCREHGFQIHEAFFYTDSHSDLPLLEAVGHPICVNPDSRLRFAARKRGWTLLSFRM
ncbi:HAD-IB family hydrolase [bacterium]|nr:HAD-IB family hydrolase [bacterium]